MRKKNRYVWLPLKSFITFKKWGLFHPETNYLFGQDVWNEAIGGGGWEETNQSGSRAAIVRMLPQVRPEGTPTRPEPRAPTSVFRRVPAPESPRTADSFPLLALQGDRFLIIYQPLFPSVSFLKQRSRRDENALPPLPPSTNPKPGVQSIAARPDTHPSLSPWLVWPPPAHL